MKWNAQINEDFRCLHPGKEDRMSTIWPNLSSKMMPLMCRSKDKEAKRIQAVMCGSTDNAREFYYWLLPETVIVCNQALQDLQIVLQHQVGYFERKACKLACHKSKCIK